MGFSFTSNSRPRLLRCWSKAKPFAAAAACGQTGKAHKRNEATQAGKAIPRSLVLQARQCDPGIAFCDEGAMEGGSSGGCLRFLALYAPAPGAGKGTVRHCTSPLNL